MGAVLHHEKTNVNMKVPVVRQVVEMPVEFSRFQFAATRRAKTNRPLPEAIDTYCLPST